ncbi:MAG TPA: hypothetical protein VNU68_34910 [Verrucomicrobiae bacterium]|nr:hypothetical protein [Verrucomicrobiae bacterium]
MSESYTFVVAAAALMGIGLGAMLYNPRQTIPFAMLSLACAAIAAVLRMP